MELKKIKQTIEINPIDDDYGLTNCIYPLL